jgi:hypothetical protein
MFPSDRAIHRRLVTVVVIFALVAYGVGIIPTQDRRISGNSTAGGVRDGSLSRHFAGDGEERGDRPHRRSRHRHQWYR